MKNLFLISLFFIATISLKAQIKVGNNPNTINANSILELESLNKGLLIPRVILNNVNNVSPLTGSVPSGMMIYSSGGTVTDGFYYWNGTIWLSVLTQNSAFVNNGNSFAISARIGTNDNQSLFIETNNVSRMKIDSLGNVGIGISTPQTLLHLHNPATLPGTYPLLQLTTGFTNASTTDGFIIGLENVTGAYNVQFKTLETGNIEFYGGNTEALYIKSTGNVGIGNSVSNPNSSLQVGGSVSFPLVTKTSNYTATDFDYTILCNTGSMIVNLPHALNLAGRIYVIKKISNSGGTITITPYSGDHIDNQGTNTWIQNQWQSITIQSDGANWFMLSRF